MDDPNAMSNLWNPEREGMIWRSAEIKPCGRLFEIHITWIGKDGGLTISRYVCDMSEHSDSPFRQMQDIITQREITGRIP